MAPLSSSLEEEEDWNLKFFRTWEHAPKESYRKIDPDAAVVQSAFHRPHAASQRFFPAVLQATSHRHWHSVNVLKLRRGKDIHNISHISARSPLAPAQAEKRRRLSTLFLYVSHITCFPHHMPHVEKKTGNCSIAPPVPSYCGSPQIHLCKFDLALQASFKKNTLLLASSSSPLQAPIQQSWHQQNCTAHPCWLLGSPWQIRPEGTWNFTREITVNMPNSWTALHLREWKRHVHKHNHLSCVPALGLLEKHWKAAWSRIWKLLFWNCEKELSGLCRPRTSIHVMQCSCKSQAATRFPKRTLPSKLKGVAIVVVHTCFCCFLSFTPTWRRVQ